MKTVRLPRSAEGALEVLIEDHRRMSFLEAHKGEISRSAEGAVCWVRGSAEFSDEWPCVLTKAFPSAREAISDAMSQVAEKVRERRQRGAWKRQIYGAEAGGK